MSAILIEGKKVASAIGERIIQRVAALKEHNVVPGLAVIIVGSDPASQVYVGLKEKACAKYGLYSEKYELPESTCERNLLQLIFRLNNANHIHGILCQLPLPKHIDEHKVINAISPSKDVDAFHPINVGKIMTGDIDFAPCTPSGVISLLDEYGIDPAGKHCVVVGRSNIVGKPVAMLLLHRHATVTIAHSRTENLAEITRSADILVVAVGKPSLVTADMVSPGTVVIDVGVNRMGKTLCGDVDFDAVREVASYITPVPGGCGPMTIVKLMENTVMATERTV